RRGMAESSPRWSFVKIRLRATEPGSPTGPTAGRIAVRTSRLMRGQPTGCRGRTFRPTPAIGGTRPVIENPTVGQRVCRIYWGDQFMREGVVKGLFGTRESKVRWD